MAERLAPWQGVVMLVRDVVEHGSRAVEKLQVETARLPFALLEAVPGVGEPARLVHAAHDVIISTTHRGIRFAGRVLASAVVAAQNDDHLD